MRIIPGRLLAILLSHILGSGHLSCGWFTGSRFTLCHDEFVRACLCDKIAKGEVHKRILMLTRLRTGRAWRTSDYVISQKQILDENYALLLPVCLQGARELKSMTPTAGKHINHCTAHSSPGNGWRFGQGPALEGDKYSPTWWCAWQRQLLQPSWCPWPSWAWGEALAPPQPQARSAQLWHVAVA